MTHAPATNPPLAGREVIVGVCGGIAAYKACDVVSKLVQRGAGVTVAMTEAATKFVTPLTFEALSGRHVMTSPWTLQDTSDPQHIKLTERADLMLVVPATTNLIAKVATGLADDLLSLMICASACPVVFAPAMNHRMWDHPVARENVEKLQKIGYTFIGPEPGWLACRNVGMGRLSEPAEIIETIAEMLGDPGKMPRAVGSDAIAEQDVPS
jgi:phosphopantothenoylcysteine decarboxylase/phosphopantothenate--cysteine ligase